MVKVPGYRFRSSGFVLRRYQILWEAVGLERGPLSLMRIAEELLERKSSGSGLENLATAGIRWADHATPSTHKSRHYFAGRSGRSVGIVRLRTKSHGVCSVIYIYISCYFMEEGINESHWNVLKWVHQLCRFRIRQHFWEPKHGVTQVTYAYYSILSPRFLSGRNRGEKC
jgi:hypothetical protein